MAETPRMTPQTQRVLRALLADPAAEHYGLQLCALADLKPGTMYPIIARLERISWVTSSWEDPVTHIAEGRPRRRYYRLTDDGAERARGALARAYRSDARQRAGQLAHGPQGETS